MKTSISIFVVVITLISSCSYQPDKHAKKFILQGEINYQDSGIIVLQYVLNNTFIHDTAKINEGNFIFTGRIFEPIKAELDGGNGLNRVQVYLEPRKMKIVLFKDKFAEFKMTGSKTQNEFDLLNRMEKPLNEKLSKLKERLSRFNDSINDLKTSPDKLILGKKTEEIETQWSQSRKDLDSIWLKFVLENKKSYVTPFYLRLLETREVISLDSIKSIFNGLENSIQQSKYGKFIIEDIRKKENIRLGAQAPDFKAIALNQQTITLSQFNGRSIVLLDFWASYCIPCRKNIPRLKTIYNKYHSKGFEVIAVSLDENKEAWTDAVKKDSTEMWYHIPIAKEWPNGPITNDDVFQNYYYKAIPEQMLIDKNGKIINILIGESIKNEESLDRLLSQIFDN
jgi:alkyl hydroperoxide reductase subunit AhpC